METSYRKPTIKTFSHWEQLNNHEIITETSYPKPTIKTLTLHYKYREPAKPTCRGLCAVTSALQTIVRGIQPNPRDPRTGPPVGLETSKIKGNYSCHCLKIYMLIKCSIKSLVLIVLLE